MTFEDPIWLYITPAVLLGLYVLFWISQRVQAKRLKQFASAELLPRLLEAYSKARVRAKTLITLLGIACILLALARPQQGYEWKEQPTRGIDVLFALDASRSMLAEDIKPNRLERAKLAILDLLRKLDGDRVGLVAFAGNAFLQCPLTLDYDAFRQSLEAIDTRTLFRGGSDLAAAISESSKSLQENRNHKIVILLTDGEDLSGTALEQARIAAEEGVTLYTVGVGTPEGDIIPIRTAQGSIDYVRDEHNRLVKTKLDATTLSSIAEITGGFFVHLGPSGHGLETVYQAGIASIPKEDTGATLKKIPIERFQWAIALALLLLALEPIIGTRKRRFRRSQNSTAWIALLSLIIWGTLVEDLRAEPPTPSEDPRIAKYRAAVEKDPSNFVEWYNLGTALYESGKYEDAIKSLEKALGTSDVSLQEKALYNIGNARYRQGQILTGVQPQEAVKAWEAAIQDYQNAHELDPSDKNAAYNQNIADKALEELKKQLEQQPPQQQGDSGERGESKNENGEGKSDRSESQSEGDEQNEDNDETQQSGEDHSPQNSDQDKESGDKEPPEQQEGSEGGTGDEAKNEEEQQDTSGETPGEGQESETQGLDEQQASSGQQDKAEGEDAGSDESSGSAPQDMQDNQVGPIEHDGTAQQTEANPKPDADERGEDLLQDWDAMRREEAAQLLNSLKAVERKLPFAGFGDHTDSDQPTQDW